MVLLGMVPVFPARMPACVLVGKVHEFNNSLASDFIKSSIAAFSNISYIVVITG